MSKTATAIPSALIKILEQPPLCVGEDRKQYEELRDIIIDEIKPRTVADYLLAYDVANAEWELLRLHGFKAMMINANMLKVLMGLPDFPASSKEALRTMFKHFRRVLAGDANAREKLEGHLAEYRTTFELVAATAYENNIAAQTQTAHMISAALQRREAAYAELERRLQNRRNAAALEAPQYRAATITDGENPPTASPEQVNDAAANTSDAAPLAPSKPVAGQEHDQGA